MQVIIADRDVNPSVWRLQSVKAISCGCEDCSYDTHTSAGDSHTICTRHGIAWRLENGASRGYTESERLQQNARQTNAEDIM